MRADGFGRGGALFAAIVVSIASVVVIGLLVAHFVRSKMISPVAESENQASIHVPSIYCEFYDFMHSSVVASYDFALDRSTPPRFVERAEVHPDGTRTEFDTGDRPQWFYTIEDGAPTIVAPDNATRILLYGLKQGAGGVFWTEAGVRSTLTRNLDGRCRQAYLNSVTARFEPQQINKEPPQ